MLELTPLPLIADKLDRNDLLLAAVAIFDMSQTYEAGSPQRKIYEALAAKFDIAIAPAPGEIRQAFNDHWRNIIKNP